MALFSGKTSPPPLQASLLSDFPRGDPDRTHKPENERAFQPPGAAFTEALAMRAPLLRWKQGRIFLGVVDGEMTEDPATGEPYVKGGLPIGVNDDRHICTFAGTRAGKGRSVIVPNMLHYPGSIVVTDPKGELAVMTARRRVAMGHTVHVLDPFGVTKDAFEGTDLRKGFNPLASMRDDSLVEDAALIADAMVQTTAGSRDPHWDESARAFLEGLIIHVRTWKSYEGDRSLRTVRQLIGLIGVPVAKTEESTKEGAPPPPPPNPVFDLEAEMRQNVAADGVVRSAAIDFFQKPPGERGSVLSTARRHLKFIDLFRESKIARHTLETHGFDLADLKARPTTIYLCLPARYFGICARWLRLFVNLTLQSMERSLSRNLPGGVPVLCILDEFAALGHMQQVEDAAGQIAGFGVKLWPILQDLGQLKSLYKERWETFLGNAGILQFFGNNDLTTLEWISRRCGRTNMRTTYRNWKTGDDMVRNGPDVNEKYELHELVTLDEAARYFGRNDPRLRQLVIWAGREKPLLVMQRAYYDKHEFCRDAAGRPLYEELPS